MNEPTNGELLRVMERVEGKVDTLDTNLGTFHSDFHARISVLEDRSQRAEEWRNQQAAGRPKRWGMGIGTAIGAGMATLVNALLGKND